MSTPFFGEIRIKSFSFVQRGWAACNGQILAISQNAALFSLLGTSYGGNGTSTFALPDLRGRIPVGQGTSTEGYNYTMGTQGGQAAVTLNSNQIPAHTHQAYAVAGRGDSASPSGRAWAGSPLAAYSNAAPRTLATMGSVVQPTGSSTSHENRMPYLALNFQIAISGIFPSRS